MRDIPRCEEDQDPGALQWLATKLRGKMLARDIDLVDQHRPGRSVSGVHPRSIPGQDIRRL